MPAYPENRYICVCGDEFRAYAKLTHHRQSCDSWKEHMREEKASQAEKERRAHERNEAQKEEDGVARWYCPHEKCNVYALTEGALLVHITNCALVKAGLNHLTEAEFILEYDKIHRDLDLLAEFEGYLRRREAS